MDSELISIIIPVYNAEKWIGQTIENIIQQTYQNFELILVDDKSTDRSVQIIEKYLDSKIRLIKLSKNSGPAIARNEGLKMAIR